MANLTTEQRELVKANVGEMVGVISGELREGESADERNALISGVVTAYNIMVGESRLAVMEEHEARAQELAAEANEFAADEDDG